MSLKYFATQYSLEIYIKFTAWVGLLGLPAEFTRLEFELRP